MIQESNSKTHRCIHKKQARFIYLAKPLRYNTLVRPLAITLGDDLPSNTIYHIPTCSIMVLDIDSAAGCLRQPFQELHVNLWIVDAHERESHKCSASKMFAHKLVYGLSILEVAKQSRQAFRLIIQRKHNLVHNCKGSTAGFGQGRSLSDPVLQ
jgi:hypothetical protein